MGNKEKSSKKLKNSRQTAYGTQTIELIRSQNYTHLRKSSVQNAGG